jgi:hypothetical protein
VFEEKVNGFPTPREVETEELMSVMIADPDRSPNLIWTVASVGGDEPFAHGGRWNRGASPGAGVSLVRVTSSAENQSESCEYQGDREKVHNVVIGTILKFSFPKFSWKKFGRTRRSYDPSTASKPRTEGDL